MCLFRGETDSVFSVETPVSIVSIKSVLKVSILQRHKETTTINNKNELLKI